MIDSEQREEIKQNARNARLESLENDNYQEETPADDDEFVAEDDDDCMYFSTSTYPYLLLKVLLSKKKRKVRKTAKEMFKDSKKKKFVAKNFNTVLEEAVRNFTFLWVALWVGEG